MSLEAQLQIRQNAMELQDYMKDLLDWEKEMKTKEKKSKSFKSTAKSSQPPVRGKAAAPVSSAPPELQQPALASSGRSSQPKPGSSSQKMASNGEKTNAAFHTYENWKRWENFDPDASSDDETSTAPANPRSASLPNSHSPGLPKQPPQTNHSAQSSPTTSQSPTASGIPAVRKAPPKPRQPETAEDWKNRGNDLFKVGKYQEAMQCYSRSIDVEPTAVAYSNRAMANIKLKEFKEAEQDCNTALGLDPTYLKALLRRGAARRELGRPEEAMSDFEEALRYEPTNKTILADRDACFAHICKQEKLSSSQDWKPISVKMVKAAQVVNTPAAMQPIAVIEPPDSNSVVPLPSTSVLATEAIQSTSSPLAEPIVPHSTAQQPAPSASTPSPFPSPSPSISNPTATSLPAAKAPHPPSHRQPLAHLPAVAAAAVQQTAANLAKNMKAPTTSTEFEAAWRSFKSDHQLKVKYISLINPERLASVFKSSLTPQLLNSLLHTILKGMQEGVASDSSGEIKEGSNQLGCSVPLEFGLRFLQGLTGVPRFDMNVMCIGGKDKVALQSMCRVVGSAMQLTGDLQEAWAMVQKKCRL